MIRTEPVGDVLVVTVDRPERLNALNEADTLALDRVLRDAAGRPGTGAVVLTGAGDRAFVAGGDLEELAEEATPADALDLPLQRVLTALADSPVPTVAAVNGYALGGGFELALACDLRLADPGASFGLPELRWSMLPAAGGITRLTRLVGPGRATELILTGRRLSAAEALALGVVTEVTEPGGVVEAAVRTARTILEQGPLAVRVARTAIRVAADGPAGAGLAAEALGLALLYGTDDRTEGVRSFVEKRAPRFTGR